MQLDPELWAVIQASLPVACVDVVLARRSGADVEVGLIRRLDASGEGTTWCHLGGRVLLHESLAEAITRHMADTLDLDVSASLGPDPQPLYAQQYFTSPHLHPELAAGVDTRKHAIGLSFLVTTEEDVSPRPGGEALGLVWFSPEDLPTDLWPGSAHMIREVLARAASLEGSA